MGATRRSEEGRAELHRLLTLLLDDVDGHGTDR